MAQNTIVTGAGAPGEAPGKTEHGGQHLGAILCWAVVFADIGTSVYYVPGILYGQVGRLAGLFVVLTLIAFLLLILKYSEVSVRFPEGGGVVTVAAHALSPWFGVVGGMFILVDYFLTSAISSLSGLLYFVTLVPSMAKYAVLATVVVIALLGLLNWWGIKESAMVTLVIALAALLSDLVILGAVVLNVPPATIGRVFGEMFSGTHIAPLTLLTGFAGAFLAFSGLESISQLSPVMRLPRKRTVNVALLLVLLTVGITSPLLTIFSTTLLRDTSHPDTFISQLGGTFGGRTIEIATAVSASALLIFAANTAIIGAYHVCLALSRMKFFPAIVERRNAWRGTPHVSILIATLIPIAVLIGVGGRIEVLGDLYAFGLLGAFSLTCIALDIIRVRERRGEAHIGATEEDDAAHVEATAARPTWLEAQLQVLGLTEERRAAAGDGVRSAWARLAGPEARLGQTVRTHWPAARLYLGFLTTALVVVAWGTNLVHKPHATVFGGGITALGMAIAFAHTRYQRRAGRPQVFTLSLLRPIPNSTLVVLPGTSTHLREVVEAAIETAHGRSLTFLYLAPPPSGPRPAPRMMEVRDPFYADDQALRIFGFALHRSRRAGVQAQFVYRTGSLRLVVDVWRATRPEEIIAEAGEAKKIAREVAPEYVRFQEVNGVRIAHYVRHPKSGPDEAPRAIEVKRATTTPRNTPPLEAQRPAAPPAAQDIEDYIWTGTDLIRREDRRTEE